MELYTKIKELKSLIEKKKEIVDEILKLKAPILIDLSHIEVIYSIFLDLLKQKGYSRTNVYHRNKFIFAVLYFYSPITLAGGPTEKGVRDEIARVLGGKSSSTISGNIQELGFLYAYYDNFREDVEYICSETVKRVEVE